MGAYLFYFSICSGPRSDALGASIYFKKYRIITWSSEKRAHYTADTVIGTKRKVAQDVSPKVFRKRIPSVIFKSLLGEPSKSSTSKRLARWTLWLAATYVYKRIYDLKMPRSPRNLFQLWTDCRVDLNTSHIYREIIIIVKYIVIINSYAFRIYTYTFAQTHTRTHVGTHLMYSEIRLTMIIVLKSNPRYNCN